MAKTKKAKKVEVELPDCDTCVADLEKRIDCNIHENGLARFGVMRPYTIFVMIAVVLILGIFSFTTLRVELFPNMNIPFVVVMSDINQDHARWNTDTATPSVVLADATRPMEQALLGVSGINQISTMSTQMGAVIIVELQNGVHIESAANRIARALPNATVLGNGFNEPEVVELDPNMMPIFNFSSTYMPYELNETSTDPATLGQNMNYLWYQRYVIGPLERERGVAVVNHPFASEFGFSYVGEDRAFTFSVRQSADAVTTTVVANIMSVLENVETGSTNDFMHYVTVTNDQGAFINQTIGGVMNNLILGAVLCILVLFLFLRSPKLTIAVAISIPLSVIGTFVLMYFMGIGLNLVSMSGLALAVGMLVDNSVIVTENIFRLRKKGYSNREAAIKGASQIFGAVIAATLTTVAVFFPMFFVQGLVMEVFMDMVWVIIFSLLASMVVAMMFLPSIIASFNIGEEKAPNKLQRKWRETRVASAMTSTKLIMNRWYNTALNFTIKWKWLTVGLSLVLFIGSFLLVFLTNGLVIMPPTDTGEFTVQIGQNMLYERTPATGFDWPIEIDPGAINPADPMNPDHWYIDHEARATTATYLIDNYIVDVVGNVLGNNMDQLAITYSSGVEGSLMQMMMGGAAGIRLNISLTDRRNISTDTASSNLEEALTAAIGGHDFVSSVTASGMETGMGDSGIVITFSSEDTTRLGTALLAVGLALENVDGIRRIDNDAFGIMSGMMLTQTDQRFTGSIQIHLRAGYNMGQVNSAVRNVVDGLMNNIATAPLFEDIEEVEDGFAAQIAETFPQMVLALLVGLVLMYLVMVAIFRSFKLPFIILMVVPLAFTGGFLFLAMFGMPISLVAMIGLLILMGVVTTNGIVLVDYINQSRRDGLSVKDSIVAAANTRTRPILMTAISTILAMVPIAFASAGGGDMMQPLAIVTIGGLIYATFMSLLVIPSFYAIFNAGYWNKLMVALRIRKPEIAHDTSKEVEIGISTQELGETDTHHTLTSGTYTSDN